MTSRIRDRQVTFWLTAEEREALRAASEKAGLSVSDALRQAVRVILAMPEERHDNPLE